MLCQKSACYDLLNRMYQASNQWDKALQLASTKDHVNLKRTFYDYARHLENQGSFVNLFFFYRFYYFNGFP